MGQIKNIKLHIVTDIKELITVNQPPFQDGQRPQNTQDLVQWSEMPKTYPSQGNAVQDRKETNVCKGAEALRVKTEGVWWTNKTDPSQEGEDNEEDCITFRMHRMQIPEAGCAET